METAAVMDGIYPVIREWRPTFLKNKDDGPKIEEQIFRFARGEITGDILDVKANHGLVGKLYGSSESPDGTEVVTLNIVRYEKANSKQIASAARTPDEKVLIAQTRRGDKYCLVVKRIEAAV